MENIKRFWKNAIHIKLKIEKHNIKTVAKLGETPILLNPLASNFIIGLNIYLNLYFDGINKI